METSIQERIVQYHKSKECGDLIKYYKQKSFFHIFKMARDENSHSDFWAWLLDPNETHSLGTFALEKFLSSLIIPINGSQSKNKNLKLSKELENLIVSHDYEIRKVDVLREYSITGGSIDIFVVFSITKKGENHPPFKVTITIENKVKANEFNSQSKRYHEYIESTYSKKDDIIYKNIFIYLTPLSHSKFLNLLEPECEDKIFIQLNYQHLLNCVLEPCLEKKLSEESRVIISAYVRSLSYPTLNEDINTYKIKGEMFMAISNEERDLLLDFWESQKDIMIKAFSVLQDDPELGKEDREKIKEMLPIIENSSLGRDRTTYNFDNQIYTKGRLVHAVIKKYISENIGIKFEALIDKFPDELEGSHGVVRKFPNPEIKTDREDQLTKKNYYIDEDEILKLEDNTNVVVSRQWGSSKNNPEVANFPKFLTLAKKLYPSIVENKQIQKLK